jgi:hypothetical protein
MPFDWKTDVSDTELRDELKRRETAKLTAAVLALNELTEAEARAAIVKCRHALSIISTRELGGSDVY